MSRRARLFAGLLGLLAAAGCAGARVRVTADRARYPLSLSPAVRDARGRLYDQRTLLKVGWLDVRKTTAGLAYTALAVPPARDFSDEINRQVAAAGGEAVVGLTVSVGAGCGWLNGFPILNVLPFWPGCVPVRLTGDIVRRRNTGP
ncbi:MAG TPA: hypothetical protein VHO06_23295 [Polyangia bacterium]|nr:hypothetical protein [Polyangia bacterium]